MHGYANKFFYVNHQISVNYERIQIILKPNQMQTNKQNTFIIMYIFSNSKAGRELILD